LAPGSIVSGRYRIERLIGEGGMGQVHEAFDLELHEHVALKTTRAALDEDPAALARFRREVQIARRITHPNVCRVFDLGTQTGEGGSLTYVTMELLRGETLSRRIRQKGPFTPREALPIVAQICDGLDAAHATGIVHRDFKSANVMLVADSAGGVRAVVADFGLARAAGGEAARLTHPDQVLGTPAYMAPEQVEGGEITSLVDVYALGCVMYEMLSARLPFEGDTPIAVALARLRQSPRPLSGSVENCDPRWEAVIDRCLTRRPQDRVQSAREVRRLLESPDASLPSLPSPEPTRSRRFAPVAALLAVLLVLAVVVLVRQSRPVPDPVAGPSSAAISPRVRTTIAVLGFRDLSGSGGSRWLSTALAEMFTTELAAGESLRTLSGEDVNRMKTDLALGDVESHGRESLARIRAHADADYVVTGSYVVLSADAPQIRIDLRLQRTSDGETIASISDSAKESELFDMVSRNGSRLRASLGAPAPSPDSEAAARSSLPASAAASRDYAAGLDKLRARDAIGARELFERTVAADPAFPLGHAALADAWRLLGYEKKQIAEARLAFDLSAGLPRKERLEIEAGYRIATGDWARAEEICRSLATFFPDEIEHGLRLAEVQLRGGRAPAALSTIAELRKIRAPLGSDPRIDLAEAMVKDGLGDFAGQQKSAAAAAAKAKERGARLLYAEARLVEGGALTNVARAEEAFAAFDEAEAVFREVGDRASLAKVWRRRASTMRNAGDVVGSIRLSEKALQLYEEIGNRSGAAITLTNIGGLKSNLGQNDEAIELVGRSLVIFREIDDRPNETWALGILGNAHQLRGDFQQAERAYVEALARAREIGDKSQVGALSANLGELYRHVGRLREALTNFDAALAIFADDPSNRAYVLASIGSVRLALGELPEARRKATAALELRKKVKEEFTIPDSMLLLASVAFEERKLDETRTLARSALAIFEAQHRADETVAARLLLARIALAGAKPADAEKEVETAARIAATSESADVKSRIAIERGRVAVARGTSTPSLVRELRAVSQQLQARGNFALSLDASLVTAELELLSGDRASARRRIEKLRSDASAAGFGLVIKEAKRINSAFG
ncbi:MAG: protein kinase, partial [Thermoanaerobaculia bacterium]|nr:protein kinase [Thermoanaerobaculia bacterium]